MCVIRRVGIVLTLLLLAASCGRYRNAGALGDIGSVLDRDPALALRMLDSMDVSSLRGEHKALFALLRTQAGYKCYEDIESDSLIRIATNWYGLRHKNVNAARSWYSLGCISELLEDDSAALDAYLRARILFPDTLVRDYALCCQNMGILYEKRHLYSESLNSLRSGLACARLLGDSCITAFCNLYIGLIHLYKEEFGEAGSMLGALLSDRNLPGYSRNNLNLQMAKVELYGNNDADAAMLNVDKYLKWSDGITDDGLSVKADIFYAMSLYDSAYIYYLRSMDYASEPQTICDNYRRLAELEAMRGDNEAAARYMSLFGEELYDIYERRSQDAITSIHLRHNEEWSRNSVLQIKSRAVLISISVVVLLSLSLLLAFLIRDRNRKAAYLRRYDDIRRRALSVASDSLADQLTAGAKAFHQDIASSLIEEITGAHRAPSDSEILVLRYNINLYFQDAIRVMRERAPRLNQTEQLFCILHYMGLGYSEASLMLNKEPSYLRAIKTRMQNKMPVDMYNVFFG